MANSNLTNAKKAKNDEFYTQYSDIQKEIEAYLDYDKNVFRGKVVYCNCDDPYESNFFRYFVLNFKKLGLKQLITTSYVPSPITGTLFPLSEIEGLKGSIRKQPFKIEINEVKDFNNDGAVNLKDIEYLLRRDKNTTTLLKGNGDFRSLECMELLKQSDIVVTNPPFSLFRQYVKQLVEHKKKFLIIGNMNAITYKEIFPLIKENKMWMGNGFHAGNAYFYTPNTRDFASGVYDEKTGLVKFRNVCWFTNLDHGRRHLPLQLQTMAENKKFHKQIQKNESSYQKYDNYDAIEVPYTNAIPRDYKGTMGVPISFLDKYNPDQFEILGSDYNIKEGLLPKLINPKWKGKIDRGYINGRRCFSRILIKNKKDKK